MEFREENEDCQKWTAPGGNQSRGNRSVSGGWRDHTTVTQGQFGGDRALGRTAGNIGDAAGSPVSRDRQAQSKGQRDSTPQQSDN
jgi:hypothetical protein